MLNGELKKEKRIRKEELEKEERLQKEELEKGEMKKEPAEKEEDQLRR